MGGQQAEECHGCLLQTTKMERKCMRSDSQLIKPFGCQTCFLPGDFYNPSICWKGNKEGLKATNQEGIKDNFLRSVIGQEGYSAHSATCGPKQTKHVKADHSVGCNLKMVIKILKEVGR